MAGSVADADFGDRLAAAAGDAYGRADVVVNNAGFLWDGMLHKMSDEQWARGGVPGGRRGALSGPRRAPSGRGAASSTEGELR